MDRRSKRTVGRATLLGGVLGLAGALLPGAPASAGARYNIAVTLEKVVIGPGPDGPYQIRFQCNENPAVTLDLTAGTPFVSAGTSTTDFLCTVVETDALGAVSVSYECVASGAAVCNDDGTIFYPQGESGAATVTVVNDFTPAPTTSTSAVAPDTTADPTSTTAPSTSTSETARAAPAVATTPTFTG